MSHANAIKSASLGERIKDLRKAKGLSQTELGVLAGVHYSHIGRYENGQAKPSAGTLGKLADALDTTTDYLLEGATDKLAGDRLSDRELLKQFQVIESMPDADKAAIKNVLDAFIKRRRFLEASAA
jgi:transcriptional regulator with XRE-family HTH domain